MKTLLTVLLAAGSLAADTLVLRDGTRLDGTMLSASGRTLTFVDADGLRRTYNLSEVQEVAFGAVSSTASRSRTDTSNPNSWDLFDRLGRDVDSVLERSTLAARQRNMLEDARVVISRAGDDLRDNRTVDSREVRTALDNIRYVMNGSGIREQDRTMVLNDIARIREQYSEYGNPNTRQRGR